MGTWYSKVKFFGRMETKLMKRKIALTGWMDDVRVAAVLIGGPFDERGAIKDILAEYDSPEALLNGDDYGLWGADIANQTATGMSLDEEEFYSGIGRTAKEAAAMFDAVDQEEELDADEWDESQIAPREDCIKLQAEAAKKSRAKARRTDRPLKGHADTADKFLEVQKAIEELDQQAAAIRSIIAEKQLVSGNLANELINYAQEYEDRMFRTEKILVQLQDIPSHKAKVPQWRQVIDHLLDKLGGVSAEMRQEGEEFIEASKREIPGSTELYYQEVESSINSVMGEAWAGFRKLLDKVKSMGKAIAGKLSSIEHQTNELLSGIGGADTATA